MNKILFLLLILISFCNDGVCQSNSYDKLKAAYDQFRTDYKYDSSLIAAKKMNSWAFQFDKDTSLRYAVSLRYVGNSFYTLSQNDSALFYWNKSLQALRKQQRAFSLDAASVLNNLGEFHFEVDDYKVAEPYFRKALEIRKKVLGEEHQDYAKSLNSLGLLYSDMGEYGSAEIYYKQALEIRRKVLGVEHQDYAGSLNNFGLLYWEMGDYKGAEAYYKEALVVYKKAIGEEHPEYVEFLNSLGNFYSDMGEYGSAEIYYKQALEIRKKFLGIEHQDYANILTNLGLLYWEKGGYKAAEPYYKQALVIYKKALGEEHPDYAESLNSLGLLYSDMGEYGSAEIHYKQALEVRRKIFGVEHQDYASILNNLGLLYWEMGDYKDSELYFNQALEIYKKTLSEEHPEYAGTLNNLGLLYSGMGDYKIAENYYKQALEVYRKTQNEKAINYSNILNNLGNLYLDIEKFEAANLNYLKSQEIKKEILGEDHPEYSMGLNNLGVLNYEIGEFSIAETLYRKSQKTVRKNFGEEHPSYALILNNLGELYFKKGDFKAAELNFKQSSKIYKKTLGENHPDYLETLNSYAFVLQKTNRKAEAYLILNQSFLKISKQVTNNFEWLTEYQKEAYWKNESSFYENLSWFANQSYQEVPEAAGLSYDAVLFTKSKMLEMKINSEGHLSEQGELNQEIDDLRKELSYRRRLLAKIESEGFNDKNDLEKFRNEADSLDKLLILRWPEYAQQKKNLSVNWQQVQENLEENEAAIEFFRFKNEEDSKYYYSALVLKKGDTYPQLFNLCKEADLQSVTVNMGYGAYYPLIWQPLENALNGIKVIYYSPSGILNNLPFHSIIVPKENKDKPSTPKKFNFDFNIQNGSGINEQNVVYLMDKYTLHQLTSTRYLAMGLKQKENEKIEPTIALVGGVNYDYLPGISSTVDKIKEEKNSERFSQVNSNKLDYLEFSKVEVDSIAANVSSQNWQTIFLEFNDATEENITKLEGNDAKAILHLATHGYFFREYNFNDTTIRKNSLQYSYKYSTNPMVRSGLILAGGNWAWAGIDTLTQIGAKQNGILTASEVSQLNLRKTKLVVLSACETGLGDIENSEGTFGLKRGFKLAGVERIIVSLWDVPDEETMELMTLFYNDLTKTLNPVNSFEKAQKEMRKKYPTDPKKWAGFVLAR